MTDRPPSASAEVGIDPSSTAAPAHAPPGAADPTRSWFPTSLHDPAELYRLLVESVKDYAIFALDPNGVILTWNAGAERIKGYRASEIIGKHFSIFYPAERVAEKFPDYELREAARVGRFEDEGWRLRKDGSRFWANVVITALRDPSGKLAGYAKVTRDLTERRATEEALRESEERFRFLVQGVRDYAIFMLDPQGNVATWNEGAERIKGYSEAEILGKHFSMFYPPGERTSGKPERELEIAATTGRYAEEGWRVRKDGSRFWASVLLAALRNDRGELIGFAKVTRDLTERRAADERALADARRVASEESARRVAEEARATTETLQRLTAAFSAATTLAEVREVIFEEGLRALRADAGALALLDDGNSDYLELVGAAGYRCDVDWLHRFPRSDALPMGEAVQSGARVVTRSRAERAARYPRLSEALAGYETTVACPLAARGRTVGALALHFIAADALSNETLALLDGFVQQCGQAVERAQLYQAEQQARLRADEANRAKSEFLAAMSHELRTPLNAIAGYADLIDMGLRGPVSPEQHEDLQRIKRSQQHLLGIINDILNFSKIEAGQVEYDLDTVPIHGVLRSVGDMIAPQAKWKGISFEVDECPPELAAFADRAKVEQILLNLLSNAMKFTESGGSVALSCRRSADRRIEITAADTGIGIPREQLERVFEPFVQVGRSLKSSREGTGLGLAISRDLARAMRGDITVQSEPGVGSKFTLSLPGSPDS